MTVSCTILDTGIVLTSLGQYAAWLRARGEHETDKREYRNWNMEAIRDMAADNETPWGHLLSDVRAYRVNLKQGILACWEEALAVLGSPSPKGQMFQYPGPNNSTGPPNASLRDRLKPVTLAPGGIAPECGTV